MIGMKLNQAKATFFDSKKVMKRVGTAARKVLSKFGAYVRTAAMSSIRTRKGISKPDRPPHSHTRLLKKFIFFGYDFDRQSVVIGPTRLNQKAGDAPEALEYGGGSTVMMGRRGSRKRRRIHIQARPYMGPAFEQEKPKLPKMWANSVKP